MSNVINLLAIAGAAAITGYFIYKVILPQLKDFQWPVWQFPDFSQFQLLPPLPPPQYQQPQQQQEESVPAAAAIDDDASSPTTPRQSIPQPAVEPVALGGGGGGGGNVDTKGIKWLYADGDITTIPQTRTETNDHRWSGNVSGIGKLGMEATMIVDFTSARVASDGHFAMKHGGPNHSGCTSAGRCQWYDTGIRQNGAIQIQTEKPHPKNHTFACSTVGGCAVNSIGKSMQGSIIGLKWVLQPQSNGNLIMLFYDENALVGGKPRNAWKKVFSTVDTKMLPGWKPPDTQDCEIRISDTSGEKAYAGGLHVRKLTKIITSISPQQLHAAYMRFSNPYLYSSFYNRRRL